MRFQKFHVCGAAKHAYASLLDGMDEVLPVSLSLSLACTPSLQGTFLAEKPADLRAGRLVIELFGKEVRHDL